MMLVAFKCMRVCTFVRIYLEAKNLAINTQKGFVKRESEAESATEPGSILLNLRSKISKKT